VQKSLSPHDLHRAGTPLRLAAQGFFWTGSFLAIEERPAVRPGTIACMIQREPARQLPHFRNIPVVVVTAEASWMTTDNHGTVDFLRQAGVTVDHLRLEEHGIHGNGHAMMLETNSDEIAAFLENWISAKGLS
jgi:acetyl esterase/lipase